jgi:hypothetical protein
MYLFACFTKFSPYSSLMLKKLNNIKMLPKDLSQR